MGAYRSIVKAVGITRHSLEFVSWKDRKPVVPALREIYRARDAHAGMAALEAFEAGHWGKKGTGARSIPPSPRAGGATGPR
jgi:transposase-like protein